MLQARSMNAADAAGERIDSHPAMLDHCYVVRRRFDVDATSEAKRSARSDSPKRRKLISGLRENAPQQVRRARS